MEIVFATNNIHKVREVQQILGDSFKLLNLDDIGFKGEIPEDFFTLEENAAQKALHIWKQYQLPTFADDTGLEVDALNGEPGVLSARYAGENKLPEDNIRLLLKKLNNSAQRSAKFRTIISFVNPEGKELLFEGMVKGQILTTEKGDGGFGYDPVFQPDGYNKTFAEMRLEEKNKISHRAIAVNKFTKYLKENY